MEKSSVHFLSGTEFAHNASIAVWSGCADLPIMTGAVAPKDAVDLHHGQMQLLAHFSDDSHGLGDTGLFLLEFPHAVGTKKPADVNVGLDPSIPTFRRYSQARAGPMPYNLCGPAARSRTMASGGAEVTYDSLAADISCLLRKSES